MNWIRYTRMVPILLVAFVFAAFGTPNAAPQFSNPQQKDGAAQAIADRMMRGEQVTPQEKEFAYPVFSERVARRFTPPSLDTAGGPDSFGYRFMDSNEPNGPTFSWITPSANATTVSGWTSTDDGYAGPYNIGFNFSWYGTTYTQWTAGTNGRIQFGPTGNASYYWQAGPFPGLPGGVYFWNYDMSVSATTVVYENLTAPNRLVVTYTNLRYLGGTFGIDAQVIVYESGEVLTLYGAQTGTVSYNYTGIQNESGSVYLTYGRMPTPSSAVLYYRLGAASNPVPANDATSVPLNTSLSWNAAPAAVSYDVKFGTVNPPTTVVSAAQTGTTYTPTLAASTTYYWQIVSNGSGGNTSAGPVWTFTTGTGQAPAAPTAGTVTAPSNTSLTLNWTDNSNDETGFPVYRSSGAGGFTLIGTAPANATSYVDNNLSPATQYFYRVFSANGNATSVNYASANGWTNPNAAGVPILGLSGNGLNTILINGIGADGNGAGVTYKIQETISQMWVQATGTLGTTPRVAGGATWTNFIVSGLASGTQYTFRAVAMNGVGVEAPGNPASITTTDENHGGPDAFGYRFVTSRVPDGPTFNWVDISQTGTTLPLTGDDAIATFDLGTFVFPFYGSDVTGTITASTNGAIQFVSTGGSAAYWNGVLPTTNLPARTLFAFWDDMWISGGSHYFKYQNMNDGRFVMTWAFDHLGQNGVQQAQVILNSNGNILFQYAATNDSLSASNSGTIGIQGEQTGGNNLMYRDAMNRMPANLAIAFTRGNSQLTAQVRNAGGNPISGALVHLLDASTNNSLVMQATTPASGNAVFSPIPTGLYRMRSFLNGYQVVTTDTIRVNSNDSLIRVMTMPVQTANPNAPRNLTAMTGQVASVPLSWQPPLVPTDAIIGYRVYRMVGTDSLQIAYLARPTDTTFTDVGLVNGRRYDYFVVAVYDEGFSAHSNTAFAYPRPTNTTQYGNVRGRVTSFETGGPIIGSVTIVGTPYIVNTDSSGYYSIVNVAAGTYQMRARCTGYQDSTIDITVAQDVELVRNYSLLGIGNAAPSQLRGNGVADDRIRLQWLAPGDNRLPTDFQKDEGAISQGIYNWNGDAYWMVTRFDPGNVQWQISNITAYFMSPGDPGYTASDSAQPVMFGLFAHDSVTGFPVLPPVWEGLVNQATPWRMAELPALAPRSGSFWLGYRTTTYNSASGWRYNRVGMDAAVNYPTANLRQNTTGWEVTNYQGFGDYMIRAHGFVSGSTDQWNPNTITAVPFTNILPTDFPEHAKLGTTLGSPFAGSPRYVADQLPRIQYMRIDQSRPVDPSLDWLNGYRIYRDNVSLATVDSVTRSYVDIVGSQNENHNYVYHVTALYTTAPTESGPSNRDTLRCNMAPRPPTNLVATSDSSTHIILAWEAPTLNVDSTALVDLAGFQILRNDSVIATVGANVLTYTDTPPELRTSYSYKVKAIDEVPNVSAASNIMNRSVLNYWSLTNYIWYPTDGWNNGPSGDDATMRVPLGFTVLYYGVSYDSVTISTNGHIHFPNAPWQSLSCPGMPNTAEPNGVVAAVWADLISNTVRWTSQGGRFVASWENSTRFGSGLAAGSFQISITTTGAVTIAWQSVPAFTDFGAGVENESGTVGIELWRNGASQVGFPGVTAQSAVSFWGGPLVMGHVGGFVRRITGAPIAGVDVGVFSSWTTVTDQNGEWHLDIPRGEWPLRISTTCMIPNVTIHNITVGADTLHLADTLYRPLVGNTTTSIEFQVAPGQSRSQTFVLSNPGDTVLTYSASITYPQQTAQAPRNEVSLPAYDREIPYNGTRSEKKRYEEWLEAHRPSNAADSVWGPDSGGVRCIDTFEPSWPTSVVWRDISTLGTQIFASTDDIVVGTTMDGFQAIFYGDTVSNVAVSSNGTAQFITGNGNLSYSFTTLPSTAFSNTAFLLWRDLVTATWKYYDSATNIFYIQWTGTRFASTDAVNFQMQIHGNTGWIAYMYNNVVMTGMTGTIGIQHLNGANNRYLQNYYTTTPGVGMPSLNNYGLLYSMGGISRWASIEPSTGAISAGSSSELTLLVTLPDTISGGRQLNAMINITTNACSTLTIPVSVTAVSAPEGVDGMPVAYRLHQNYPNPFNPMTDIRFDLRKAGFTRLTVYNTIGQEVTRLISEPLPAGYHVARFDASKLAGGVYFYRIESGDFTSVRKMVLVK